MTGMGVELIRLELNSSLSLIFRSRRWRVSAVSIAE